MDAVRDVRANAAVAARQAGWMFVFTAVLGVSSIPQRPDRWEILVGIGAADLATALAVRRLPWHRWSESAGRWLLVPLLAALTTATWTAGDFAALTGPFYVLVSAWLGLHVSPRFILGAAPAFAAAYGLGLVVADSPAQGYGAIVVLFPIGTVLGVVIARHVGELRSMQAQLHTEERWRAAIMATLAHDVRSPLTTIIGTLEVLEEDPAVPVRHLPLVAAATRQAQRIMRLATGLLEVERVEQGRLRLDHHTVCVADLAQEVAHALDASQVHVVVEPDLSVWADRERLEQMLVNLAANALRHGLPPVVIEASATPTEVCISVRDHGDGVPAAARRHLFDRLSSSDQSPHSVGLGLWIVRLLAEAHGGSVEYRSASPGSRFLVRLPQPATHPQVVVDPASELRPTALI